MNRYNPEHYKELCDGWSIQSSTQVPQTGADISKPDFDTAGWYPTVVPSTVLATLVANGVHENPYFAMNLKGISTQAFDKPWWYRTEFQLSQTQAAKTVLLEFDGINYSANIWLNGSQIAAASEVRGSFRRFKYDVSHSVRGGTNGLAAEVTGPKPGDFSTGFMDWNPPPPDGNMGLFRGVRLRLCDQVSIDKPFVRSQLALETLADAKLTVTAELENHADRAVSGVLTGEIEGMQFRQAADMEPGRRTTITFSPEQFPQLNIKNPRIWWPHNLGEPNLYDLHLKFITGDSVSDGVSVRFGIRHVEDYVNENAHRGFKINGKKVLIKGGGWTDDLFLADTAESIEAQITYVKHMNLNSIRLEGFWGKGHRLYDLCDEYGILIMVGWSCHWEHEQYLGKPVDERYGGVTSAEDIELISKSWEDQVFWLRNHPSIYVWALASDKVPTAELERRYVETLAKYDPDRPYLVSAGGVGSEQKIVTGDIIISDVSGSSGVKMLGPYAYTPPVYWYTDTERGGAYGFNTETCPGAVVPPLESIRKMIPREHLWPIDEYWEFHCALNEFDTLDRYEQAINRRYGKASNVEEFARKAQVLNYELMRPMFEAFAANRPTATGIIQWMLNAAWPKMYWQLYDRYLMPNGAFYGAKKACAPLHVLYHYGDCGVYLSNERLTGLKNVMVQARVLDLYCREVFNETVTLDVQPDSVRRVLELPQFDDATTTYFLDLRLRDEKGTELDTNFYWLSTKADVLDYEAKVEPWAYYTPSKGFADFTPLNALPPARVNVEHHFRKHKQGREIAVELENASDHLAFFIELSVRGKTDQQTILPVFWEDNYVSLLPRERRVIKAVFAAGKHKPVLSVTGWNIEAQYA